MSHESIDEVKTKYEDQLMDIDGVVGVGIGTDDSGQPAIVVFLRYEPASPDIPQQLEGYQVTTELGGEIGAL